MYLMYVSEIIFVIFEFGGDGDDYVRIYKENMYMLECRNDFTNTLSFVIFELGGEICDGVAEETRFNDPSRHGCLVVFIKLFNLFVTMSGETTTNGISIVITFRFLNKAKVYKIC